MVVTFGLSETNWQWANEKSPNEIFVSMLPQRVNINENPGSPGLYSLRTSQKGTVSGLVATYGLSWTLPIIFLARYVKEKSQNERFGSITSAGRNISEPPVSPGLYTLINVHKGRVVCFVATKSMSDRFWQDFPSWVRDRKSCFSRPEWGWFGSGLPRARSSWFLLFLGHGNNHGTSSAVNVD